MAAFNKFDSFVQELGKGTHNLSAHTLKACFTNSAPVVGNTLLANITEITAGGGYLAGGVTLAGVTWTNVSGISKLVITDNVFTATGTVNTFRYIVLYNATATNGPLIGWYDYGSNVSMLTAETFTIDFDAVNGVATLQ